MKIVNKWFGEDFQKLHPKLQQLHINGGKLIGDVAVKYGNGVAGFIGRRLAKKLGIPGEGDNKLQVSIAHSEEGLHWDRIFNDSSIMKSLFIPMVKDESKFWIEKTGPIELVLTVDIIDGAWHWRCLGYKLFGLPLPKFLFPKSVAYKTIVDDKYQFFVGFNLWFFGELLSYQGILELKES